MLHFCAMNFIFLSTLDVRIVQALSFVYKRNRDRERYTSISTGEIRLLSTELAIPLEQDRILAAAARSSAVVVAILSP
jgi:hypothetical protein